MRPKSCSTSFTEVLSWIEIIALSAPDCAALTTQRDVQSPAHAAATTSISFRSIFACAGVGAIKSLTHGNRQSDRRALVWGRSGAVQLAVVVQQRQHTLLRAVYATDASAPPSRSKFLLR